MKILHVVSSLEIEKGGVSAAVIGLANLCVQANLPTRIAYTGDPSQAENKLLRAEATSLSLDDGGLFQAKEIETALDSQLTWADVVHVHAVWEPVQRVALRLAIKANKSVVFSPHGMLDRWSLSQKRWKKRIYLSLFLRRLLTQVEMFHATCSVEAQMIKAQGFERPIKVLPLGVERSEFESLPTQGNFRKRLAEKAADGPLILFLSRIHPKKGVEILLEAFAKSGLQDKVHLSIAGPGEREYVASLQSFAKSLDVDQSVSFPGMLFGRERIEALVDADLFVLPSHQENFGIAVLESMA